MRARRARTATGPEAGGKSSMNKKAKRVQRIYLLLTLLSTHLLRQPDGFRRRSCSSTGARTRADVGGYVTSYLVSAIIHLAALPFLALARRENAPSDTIEK
ncbi:MAG: hypothetical protein ABR543_12680 [Gemmatimonadaceae bacterium]